MRVLVINPFNDRSEVSLYLGLAQAGIDMEVACDPNAGERQTLRDGGITVTEMTPIRHRLDLPAAWRLRKKLRQTRYDIIYTTLNRPLAISLIASIGMDIKHVAYRGTIGHIHRWDPASWLTYLNPSTDRIICLSEAVRKHLLSLNLPAERLTTIYKGHDPAWYTPMKRETLAQFNIPASAFVIGFIGKMRPVKGVTVLIKTLRFLPGKLNFHLLLAGEVKDPGITKLAADPLLRDRIHFTGYREDAAAIAGACDVFVMPSLAREGLCRALIEAMAQGVAPVVTSVGGMPELVINNTNGLVVPPSDPEALAKAISYLADNPAIRQNMGQNARNRISSDFNIKTTISKTLQVFQELTRKESL